MTAKFFIAGLPLLAASKTADAITTRQVLDRGGWENDFVFEPPYLVRWTGRALIGHEIVEHARLAACNAGINVQAAQIQNCRPLVPGL